MSKPRTPRKQRKGIAAILGLYDELLYWTKARNESARCTYVQTENDEFSIDCAGSYCNERITYYYLIERYPRTVSLYFKEEIRAMCKSDVRVSFIDYIRPHKIEWDSPQMRSKLRVMERVGAEKSATEVSAYNLHENLGSMQSQKWIEDSLTYLAEADVSRGRGLLKSSTMLCISGTRGADFDTSVKTITEYAKHIGIKLSRVMYNVPDAMKAFSPFSHTFVSGVSDNMPSNVLSDEILARFNTYSQGILGAGGVYFGSDIKSGFPVLKKVKLHPEDPENWLITAETGGGKSFGVKMLLLQLLALGYNGTIMDIEGNEYTDIGEYMAKGSVVQFINMSEGSGKYFDPVEIAPHCGVPEIDQDAKNMSVNFTLAMFKVLLGQSYQRDEWLDTIIDDAVGVTYTNAGITDDPSTWGRSKNLSLFDVYDTLKGLHGYRKNPEYELAIEKAVAMVSRYFEPNGTRASVFKNRVSVSEVASADLVICSFGMRGKSEASVDMTQLALMQLGAAQFSHQRSIFSKAKGRFNFKIWEEFQRWGKFPDSDKTIGVAVTGGRKLGDVNIIITNQVSALLKDDKFGIFDNVQSVLIGNIRASTTRADLCTMLSIPQMQAELDNIAEACKSDDFAADDANVGVVDSEYNHAFLVGLDGNKYGIVKFLVPPAIAKSPLFYTGVDTSKNKDTVKG